MAAAEGPVAEFSSFANFEEKKRKLNLLMPFPKTGNQMGYSGQISKKSFFRFCRPILDIFGFTLLNCLMCAFGCQEHQYEHERTAEWPLTLRESIAMPGQTAKQTHPTNASASILLFGEMFI